MNAPFSNTPGRITRLSILTMRKSNWALAFKSRRMVARNSYMSLIAVRSSIALSGGPVMAMTGTAKTESAPSSLPEPQRRKRFDRAAKNNVAEKPNEWVAVRSPGTGPAVAQDDPRQTIDSTNMFLEHSLPGTGNGANGIRVDGAQGHGCVLRVHYTQDGASGSSDMDWSTVTDVRFDGGQVAQVVVEGPPGFGPMAYGAFGLTGDSHLLYRLYTAMNFLWKKCDKTNDTGF